MAGVVQPLHRPRVFRFNFLCLLICLFGGIGGLAEHVHILGIFSDITLEGIRGVGY